MSVTIYKDCKSTSGGSLLDAARFTDALMSKVTEQWTLRLQHGDKEALQRLPAITWNAFFPSGTRSADKALASGFAAIELTGLENASRKWASIAHLSKQLGFVMAFRSPDNTVLTIVARSNFNINFDIDLAGAIRQNQIALANAIGCPTGFEADGDPCKGYPVYHHSFWLHQDCSIFGSNDENGSKLQIPSSKLVQPAAEKFDGSQSSQKLDNSEESRNYGITESRSDGITELRNYGTDRKPNAEQKLVYAMLRPRAVSDRMELITESRSDGITESGDQNSVDPKIRRSVDPTPVDPTPVDPTPVDSEPEPEGPQESFKGIPLKRIAEEWVKDNVGEPAKGQYTQIISNLAIRMRHITEYEPTAIFYAIPHFDLSDEAVKAECVKACKAAKGATPHDLMVIISRLEREMECSKFQDPSSNADATTAAAQFGNSNLEFGTGLEPQESLATIVTPPLPPVFKQFHDTAPEDFKQAAVLCLLPLLGTLGSRLRAKYLNGKMETPSFQVTLEAPQASGKSFIEKMTDRCLKELKAKDDDGHALERQYQEADKMARLGTTKQERKDHKQEVDERKIPIIRLMPATASITKLLIRMENAQGLHLFALAVEIDTVAKAFKRGFSNLSDLLRCAFDNSLYGQDYATDTSYSGNLEIYYNTLYSGTPNAVRRFYPDSEDGTLSRTLFVTFPDQFGKQMPIWRDMTAAENAAVDDALRRLYLISLQDDEVQPEHVMDMDFLNKRLAEWLEEQRLLTIETQDRTRNTFYRRCAELAFRAGMVAYYLYGEKPNSRIKSDVNKFAVWVAEKMLQQFLMRVEPMDQSGKGNFFAKAVYNALPDQFTREQLEQKLKEYEFRTDCVRVINVWRKSGCISSEGKYGAKNFRKTH